MTQNNGFSCVVIGGGTLPVRCAEILLDGGHEIKALVSSDPEVKRWAVGKGIPLLPPTQDLSERLAENSFDYLFSIVNENILSEEIIALPCKFAINYHDALLPRYAGTHATSWALINGETWHGVTWHLISDVVDAGDILRQKQVDIAPDDTALTLNSKCYEAAISSFSDLVGELAAGRVLSKKQNLDARTFFARFKRPANGCVISWHDSAEKTSAMVRALNFGHHANPLGRAKFRVGAEFFIISELEILDAASAGLAGTISKINDEYIQVSTANKEVILRKVHRLDGRTVAFSEWSAEFGLSEGVRFRDLDSNATKRLDGLYAAISRYEPFWVKKLAALEPITPPYAKKAVSTEAPHYESLSMILPDEILVFLKEGRQMWKTGDFLLAAFGSLLARLSGVECFDVGYNKKEIQSEITGLENFVAAQLPLRFDIDRLQSFTEYFITVERQSELLKSKKTYARDLVTRYPQLLTASETDNFTLPVAVETSVDLGDYKPLPGSELTFAISESESVCRWFYDAAKIKSEDVEKIAGHFTVFLKGIVANPDCQIAYLPLLTDKERHQLLIQCNDNSSDYAGDMCIHHFFEAQVLRTPDATALIFGDERLTYRELNSRSNQLARFIQKLGVKPEFLVGICTRRSVEMIVGILAILKAGGAYVPLDPAYPQERLALMLEDSRVSILLTQQKLAAGLTPHLEQVLCLDSDWDQISKGSDENPISLATTNNLSYVIYTSGSTGKPKGVAIEHRSASAFLHWATSTFTVEQLKGVLASTSVCFDLSIYEMFAPLSCGGAVVLVENVLHLPDSPAAGEVTLINSVPSAIAELLRINGVPPSVRTVNLAGEPLKASLVQQLYELGSVQEVFDLYGPTEDTTYSTYTLRDTGAATIGRPISNTQAYILDSHLQPVPTGIPGELYLGGDGLARGYLNRPELTDERFIKNPFPEGPSARLYKTGDLVRYLPDRKIEYLGRIDNQVKIRGFRIELGEIESLILKHPAVRDSVVVAREDSHSEKRLVAYFVPHRQGGAKISDLRSYIKQKLPDYMIPAAFVELDELPLTPNGKVDRKALPAPTANLSDADRIFVSSRNDMELQLTNIWETILNVRPIGVNDDFFEMGGNSLQAVRMFVEVEKTFGKSVPLATLFETNTVEKLAGVLRQDEWSAPESSIVPIQPDGTNPPFFCIHAKGGNVLFYRDLARYMGTDQPFYGVQARRLAGRQIGHDTVEEMAGFYIEEMQAIQIEGPYYLGGSSFGGLAAFEMAQQLRKRGHKVALLALLDTGTPDYPKILPGTTKLRSKIYGFTRSMQRQRDSLKALNLTGKFQYMAEKMKKIWMRYHRKIQNNYKKTARRFYKKFNQNLPSNLIQLEDKIWRAGQTYAPQVYPGKVTLFRAANQPLGIYPDPTLGWERFVGGDLEIFDVPGHHGSIVAEPYVRELAEKLRHCINTSCLDEEQANNKLRSRQTDERELVQMSSV